MKSMKIRNSKILIGEGRVWAPIRQDDLESIFDGIVYCGICGEFFKKSKVQHAYILSCPNHKKLKFCTNSRELSETMLLRFCKSGFRLWARENNSLFERFFGARANSVLAREKARMAELQREEKNIEDQILALTQSVKNGSIPKFAIKKKLAALEDRRWFLLAAKNQLEKEIRETEAVFPTKDCLKIFFKWFLEQTEEKIFPCFRKFLKSLNIKVRVFPDGIVVE